MKSPIFVPDTRKSNTKKGQVFTWDLAISISIFLIVIAMLFYMWDTTISKVTETREIYEMESIATEAAEQLIRTPGVPHDWEDTDKYEVINISSIGLANVEPRVLNDEKILRFVDLANSDYDTMRALLGIREYDFYFNMTYFNETINETINETQLFINGKEIAAGTLPSNASFTISARRTAILNDKILKLYFSVWINRTYAPTVH